MEEETKGADEAKLEELLKTVSLYFREDLIEIVKRAGVKLINGERYLRVEVKGGKVWIDYGTEKQETA